MQAQKYRKFRVRTYSTVAMIGGFILIIYLGHVPLMLLIFTIQVTTSAVSTSSRSVDVAVGLDP